ncbi:hypothetical protein [Cellulomonas sp. URHD0024]|uniref:hypothetical protein n=1 Tax=Cellulomonas sp. URHD0024 TaxID=1302620 RepID=UPI001E4A10CF|nr:hypothetical protein [Cellulomonas sp. URHD0024]
MPLVIPLLEPDEDDEYDEYDVVDEPTSEPVQPPVDESPVVPEPQYGPPVPQPPYGAPAAQQPYGTQAPQQPFGAQAPQQPYGAQAPQPPYGQPSAQPPFGQADPHLGQGYALPSPPQQLAPAAGTFAPQTPAPHQYGSEYAPPAQEAAPYAAQAPFGQPSPAFGQPSAPFGQSPAPFGQPPASFGPPPSPFGQPAGYPPPTSAPGMPQPTGGWQGGPQQWDVPAKKSTGKTVLIVLAITLGAMMLVGILSAIAIPVFLNQRAKAEAAGLGLDAVTCEQVADYAVQISAAGKAQDAGPLVSMTGVSLAQDNRSSVRAPAEGEDPAFVMSCTGTGAKPDGTTAPVTANLYIDSTPEKLVAYAWDK